MSLKRDARLIRVNVLLTKIPLRKRSLLQLHAYAIYCNFRYKIDPFRSKNKMFFLFQSMFYSRHKKYDSYTYKLTSRSTVHLVFIAFVRSFLLENLGNNDKTYVCSCFAIPSFYYSICTFQSISGVGLLSSPVFGDEELYFVKDVTDLGNILKAIIRNIEDSKNKNKT